MELILNLAWLAIAGAIACHWLKSAGVAAHERRQQLIAVLVLIAILFPVISVSDDLVAVQNTAESDNFLRREPALLAGGHPVHPMIGILPLILVTSTGLPSIHSVVPITALRTNAAPPNIAVLYNRPPPAA